PVNVISDSGDTLVGSFTTNSLSNPINMQMHIVVPDQPAMPGGYDKEHTARAVFDVSGLPAAGAGGGEATTTSGDSGEEVANPPTGDSTPVALYVTLLLASVAIFTIYKVRTARN